MESSTAPRKVTATTIAEAFRQTVERKPDEVAIRTKGDAFTITWAQLRDRVDALAAGLGGLGLKKGDSVALMFGNRPEFHLCDLAVMMVGGTPFSSNAFFSSAIFSSRASCVSIFRFLSFFTDS